MALRFASSKKKTKSPTSSDTELAYDYSITWPEKYEPKLSKELALHHSKIKATRDWLLRSCSESSGNDNENAMYLISL
jgi:hypothetical protein